MSGRRLPACAVASIALPPIAHVAGAAVVVALGHSASAGLSITDFSRVSRTAVLLVLTLIVAAAVVAVISLARREHPRLLAVMGLAVNIVLIGLFWRLEFYALGFDQDSWAPR